MPVEATRTPAAAFLPGARSYLTVTGAMFVLSVVAGFALFHWRQHFELIVVASLTAAWVIGARDLRQEISGRVPSTITRVVTYGVAFVLGTPVGHLLGFLFVDDG